MDRKQLQLTNILLGVMVVFATGVLLNEMQAVLLPFLLALFLSFIFKPVIIFLRKKSIPNIIALLMVFIFISALFFGLSSIIYKSFESFVSQAPKYQQKLLGLLREFTLMIDQVAYRLDVKPENFSLGEFIDINALTSVLTYGAGSLFSGLGNVFIIMLVMFFILAGSGNLSAKVRNAFKEEHAEQLSSMIESIDLRVRQYLITKTLVSVATGTLTTMILMILGVDFALLWGFLTFLLNYIPNIGSTLSVVFPFTISLLQFDTIGMPLLVLILLVVTQVLMGNVIEPKVMAFSLNLSPLLVISALIFWGWLWGVWGMILSVPMMSILKIVFENTEKLRPIAVLMSGMNTEAKKIKKESQK
ncbi:MAG: AI-2E family transporter [Bacteroidetes bacterium]|nr:AI-2E family transporter [Bacteroidota bacterium]